ncbi:MAG: O-antigen ligase family protein [Candidatus Gracilibacteria bacterium]
MISPWGFDTFETPKNVLFKSALALVFMLWGGAHIFGKTSIGPRLTHKEWLMLAGFLVILGLSMLTSVHPELSFWGSLGRQGGVINYLAYAAIFVVGIQLFGESSTRANKNRQLFLKCVLIAGVLMSIIALLQRAGMYFFGQNLIDGFAGRSFSTIGNPTMMGAYLIFPIGAALALLQNSKLKERDWWPAILWGAIALMVAALFAAENRASILALGVMAMLHGLFLLRLRNRTKFLLFSLGIIALMSGLYLFKDEVRSLASRWSIWTSCIEWLSQNPFVGSGAESFGLIFESIVRPDFFETETYLSLADRPHNEFLEWWIHFGLLGALFYVWLVVSLVKAWLTQTPQQKHLKPEAYWIGLALIGFLVSNQFSFSIAIHGLYFALFLAFLISYCPRKGVALKPVFTKVVASLAFVAGLGLLIIQGSILIKDSQMSSAVSAFKNGHAEELAMHLEAMSRWQPHYPEYYLAGTDLAIASGDLALAQQLNGVHRRITHDGAQALLVAAEISFYMDDHEATLAIYESLEADGRNLPLLYQHWARVLVILEDFEAAAQTFDKLFVLLPDYWKANPDQTELMSFEQRIFWKQHPWFVDVLEDAKKAYEETGRTESLQSKWIPG